MHDDVARERYQDALREAARDRHAAQAAGSVAGGEARILVTIRHLAVRLRRVGAASWWGLEITAQT